MDGAAAIAKIDILKDWYRRIWIEGELDAIGRYFAPRATADGLMPDGQVGPADFEALVPAFLALVRDLNFDIDRWHEAGDWLWAQVTFRGTGAHDMRQVAVGGQVMLRFEGSMITEAYNAFDFLNFFTSAGLLPEDAFLILLSGERIG